MKSKSQVRVNLKYLVFFLLTAFLNLNSCKKETTKQELFLSELQPNKLSLGQDYSWLSSKQKVTPQEITPWLERNLPDGYKLDLHLEKAQQNVINNHHVIRIPIGNDAALFFTKANDSLKVYAYKWLDQKPGEKLYTGKLFTYSFQDQFITAQVYNKGQLIKEESLSQNSPNSVAGSKSTMGVSSNTIKVLDIGNGVASVWCWLTGGTWTGFYTNTCAWGQNSWTTKVSNIIASVFDGNDSSGSSNGTSNGNVAGIYSGGVSDANGNYNFYANYSSFGGYSLGNNGAGVAWISLWVPPDSNACTPGSGTPQGPSPTISETSDCSGHWENININIDPIILEISPEDMNLVGTDPDAEWWTDNSMDYLQKQSLPSYARMFANYPKTSSGGEKPAFLVAQDVGGEVEQLYVNNGYANACALRISIALNKSGINIPHIQDHTFQGSDSKYYFLSAAKLFHFLKKTFPSPNIDMNGSQGGQSGIEYKKAFSEKQGLFMMVANDPSQNGYHATGHASIFDGTYCVGGESHTPFNIPGGVKEIVLWILP